MPQPDLQDLCEQIACYEQRLFNPTERDLENKRILGVDPYFHRWRADLFIIEQLRALHYCLGIIARTLHPRKG